MATASGDRAHWLRRVVPLWLVIPLYAAVVAWVGALAAATQGIARFLPMGPGGTVFTESGEQIDVPQPTDNFLTNMGLVLIMRIGNIDWSTVPLVALFVAAAVVALHRAAGGGWHWPRVAALGGLVVGAGYALAVLSPLLAMKFEEPFLGAFGMMTRSDDYAAYGWAGNAAVCLALVVVFANLAFQRGPQMVSQFEAEPVPEPQDQPEPERGSDSAAQIQATPQPVSEPIAAAPAPVVVAAPDPVTSAPSAPSAPSEPSEPFTGNGQGPQRGDPDAAYRRPPADARAD